MFGAFINICGSVCINLGTNLMKLGIMRFQKRRHRVALQDALIPHQYTVLEQHRHPNLRVFKCCLDIWTWIPARNHCSCRRALVSKTWVFGLMCFILGNILNFLSFGYAAQSLLASLGSVQFVTNVLFARVVLKEQISWRTLMGTMVLMSGVCLVVGFSCHGNPAVKYSLTKLISLFYDPAYLVYLACLGIMLLLSMYVLRRRSDHVSTPENTDKLEALAYAVVSASVGAHAVTFFKILSELMGIATSVTPDDHVTKQAILHSPFTYIIIVAAILTSVFWMQRLNEALRLYNALLIIPLFQVMWVSLSVIGGGIFFHEFQATCFHGETAFMFILGLLVIFSGVFLLSPQVEEEKPLATAQERLLQLGDEGDSASTVVDGSDIEDTTPANEFHVLHNQNEEQMTTAAIYSFGVNVVPVFGVVESRAHQQAASRSPRLSSASSSRDIA